MTRIIHISIYFVLGNGAVLFLFQFCLPYSQDLVSYYYRSLWHWDSFWLQQVNSQRNKWWYGISLLLDVNCALEPWLWPPIHPLSIPVDCSSSQVQLFLSSTLGLFFFTGATVLVLYIFTCHHVLLQAWQAEHTSGSYINHLILWTYSLEKLLCVWSKETNHFHMMTDNFCVTKVFSERNFMLYFSELEAEVFLILLKESMSHAYGELSWRM